MAAGPSWQQTELVFTSTLGSPLDASNVWKKFRAVLRDNGLPIVRLHDLRHTAASLMLAQGVAPRTIMEVLGHSQISTTMNSYAHVLDESKQEAADSMGRVLAGT